MSGSAVERTVDIKYVPDTLSIRRIMHVLQQTAGPVAKICMARDKGYQKRPGNFYLLYVEFASYEGACRMLDMSEKPLTIMKHIVVLHVTWSKKPIANHLPDTAWRQLEPVLQSHPLNFRTQQQRPSHPKTTMPPLGPAKELTPEEYHATLCRLVESTREQLYGTTPFHHPNNN